MNHKYTYFLGFSMKVETKVQETAKRTDTHKKHQLRRWIRIPALMDKLTANSGYHIGQKILTPKQVSIIVEHLGYP